MSIGRWTVKPCASGWVVETPDGTRIFWASNLRIAHKAATTYADTDAATEVQARFRRIVSHTWPADLDELIRSDTRDALTAQGLLEVDEDTVRHASEALMRLMENGGDLDE
jgi:hypothetical protein